REKCPLQLRGQQKLFSHPHRCLWLPKTNGTPACTRTAAHSCEDPVPTGGSLHNIPPQQPQSAETFFLAPPLPGLKRQ
ncbi:hypothetical protein GOODEAATRI_017530, partial [Goodea atripinnis]